MGNLLGKAFGQVDDADRVEWAPLNAHTATNAQSFRDEADGAGFCDFNADFASLVDRASFHALKRTLFRLALVRVNDSNAQFLVTFFRVFIL